MVTGTVLPAPFEEPWRKRELRRWWRSKDLAASFDILEEYEDNDGDDGMRIWKEAAEGASTELACDYSLLSGEEEVNDLSVSRLQSVVW